jgi:holin-like protein
MWLLVFLALGELLGQALGLPLPGSVLGMVLMAGALQWARVREPVAACAHVLLTHLSLLFVPAGVGVMVHVGLLSRYGWQLLGILLVSTALGLGVTALVLQWLTRDEAGAAGSEGEGTP